MGRVTYEEEKRLIDLLFEFHRRARQYGQRHLPEHERCLRKLITMLVDTFDRFIEEMEKEL